jgi:glycosyltransferase involved in cell wall biosynthesis
MLFSDLLENPDAKLFWGVAAYRAGSRILSKSRSKYRLVVTTSPPHSSQVFGCLLARRFGLPHIMDLRDPWTDIYRGYKSAFRIRLESAMESFAVRSSACVISSTETYTALLRSRYSDVPPERFLTITNSYEEEKFASTVKVAGDRFVIAYLGIFYPRRNPYCFFYALQKWLAAHPERRKAIEFRIIGDSDPTTNRMIASLGLSDVAVITGRVPHEKAIQMTRSSDLLLIATGTGPATPRGWIPSKLFEYLACGRPILANIPEGDASDVIRRTKSGDVVANEDPEAMVKILEREYLRKYSPGETDAAFVPDREEIAQYGTRAVMGRFARAFDNAIK